MELYYQMQEGLSHQPKVSYSLIWNKWSVAKIDGWVV